MFPAVMLAATGPVHLDLLALLLVLAAAWGAGHLAMRVGMPAVLGELLAGVLLGPPALGLLTDGPGLAAVGELGILLMMLAIGMHVDIDDVLRAKVPGVLAAIGGFVVPAGAGTLVLVLLGYDLLAAVFVGVAIAVTSLATKSRILADLDLFGTRIAHVLVAGALLSDTALLIVFAVIMGFVELGVFDLAGTIRVAVEVTAFLGIVVVVGRSVLPRVAAAMHRRSWNSVHAYVLLVLGVGFGFGVLAETAGLHALLGTFMAGMFLRAAGFSGPSWYEATDLVEGVTMRMLAPVFFVTAGFAISFEAIVEAPGVLAAVFAVAMLGKILGTALFYLPTGLGIREGLVIGAGMNGRGAVEIIVAGIGLQAGVIDETLFTVLVFTAIGTTATVPPMLTWGVNWLRATGDLPAESGRDAVVIIGGGPLGLALAGLLADGRQVTVVDANPRHVEAAQAAGLRAVRGDALDDDVLEEAGTSEAGYVLAVTPNAEVNVLAAALARELFGVAETKAALGQEAGSGLRDLAIQRGVAPLQQRPVDIEKWEHRLATGMARVVTHHVSADLPEGGVEHLLGDEGLALVVERDGQRFPVSSTEDVTAGDGLWMLELTSVPSDSA